MPLILILAVRLRGQALLRFITLASLLFYSAHGKVWFILPMIFTTVVDFYLAQVMENHRKHRGKILVLSLSLNLGLLFFFKYIGLFASTAEFLLGTPMSWGREVYLPAGISFYTFQTISYMVDVYRGHAHVEKNFWRFSSFISFFPHLVAGPLTRHNQLIPSLDKISKVGIAPMWKEGIFLFTTGLAKKVLIADRISEIIDPLLSQPDSLGLFGAWACMLGYTMQIYFDFSGYSDMAIGLGRLFNIELPQNFNSPYKALDIVDFWRRWHMTLSNWLRDYLYISLGGNRKGPFRQKINLMMTMFLGGLWHGANWTFAAWGIYHGFLLILNHSIGGKSWVKSPIISRLISFLLVAFGWVLFRSDNFHMATIWFRQLFVGDIKISFFYDKPLLIALLLISLTLCQVPLGPLSLPGTYKTVSKPLGITLGLLAAVSLLYLSSTSKFLYFQF